LRALTTRAIAYGSVLYAPDQAGQEGLARLLPAYRQSLKSSALFIELRNLHDVSAIQPILGTCHYDFVDYWDYLVDTSLPVDAVLRNLHKSAQKKIAQALKKQRFDIVEAQELAQVKLCYSILKKTYANAHIPLVDYSMFEAAFKTLYPKGMVKFLLGQVDGQAVAASVALIYKDVIYDWYQGFDRAFAAYLPNDLMVWYLLKWGAEHQFRTFDFGGAGRPEETYGPRQFKAKFGGLQVNVGRNVCVTSPNLLRISKWGYELLRNLSH
jgi:hypothetical protein